MHLFPKISAYSFVFKKYFKTGYFLIGLFILFITLVNISLAATSGPNNPATIVDDNSIGTINWTNPTRATSSDNFYATASLDDNQISHYLKATNFGFSIPAGSTINGITISVEKKAGNASRIQDYRVRIVKGGVIGATDKANSNWWGTSDASTTYGGSADLWGQAWTVSDINNPNFGVAISAYKNSTAGNAVVSSVDNIRITITYTVNTTPNIPVLVSPASGSSTNDNTPTLSANYSDPDAGDTGTTNYRIATSSLNCTTGMVVASGTSSETPDNNENTTWTPGSSIGNDRTYYWCAQNNDGVATSSWANMGNFILDTTGPTLTEITPVPTPATSTTPSYTFNTTEAGPITYSGDCSSATVNAISGNNTIIFNTLALGTHNNCTIRLTDSLGNLSNILNVTSFTIIPPPVIPTKFVITGATNGTIDLPSYITIQAQNNSGELATTYQQDVTLIADGSATGDGLVNIVNGIGTTTISDEIVEIVHLSLSDSEGTGLNISSNADISFGPGETAKLIISATTTNLVAGTRLPVTISRYDRLDNIVTAGSESFYLYRNSLSPINNFYNASSGGEVITTVLISNGSSIGTVWYYDELVSVPEIEVSDNSSSPDGTDGVTDGQVDVTVSSAPTSALLISDPGDMTVGDRLHYEVSRQDQFGNPSDNGSVTVYLYHNSISTSTIFYNASSGGEEIDSIVMGSGVVSSSFWFYAERYGNVSITVSDNSSSPDGAIGVNDASDSLYLNPGPVGIFILDNPGNMTAGTRLGYTVSRFDAFNNPINIGDTTVYLYSNPVSTSTVFYNTDSGGSIIDELTISDMTYGNNFWLYSDETGDYDIIVSDNSSSPDGNTGVDDGTDTVTVIAAPVTPTRFVIKDVATTTVGDTASIIIKAEDDSGNIDTGYNGSVTLHTSGDATPGGIVSIINGAGSINVIDTTAEIVSLTLEDTAGTGLDISSTKDIIFLSDVTASFTITGVGSSVAGERVSYIISRKDQYNNQVTSGADTVYLYSNSATGTTSFYNAASGGSQIFSSTILDGDLSAEVWFTGTKTGTTTISASDHPTSPDGGVGIVDGTASLVISSAATARLFLNNPGDMTTGTRLGYTATRYDAYGNLVTVPAAQYYLYSNAGSTSTAFYPLAIGGSPIMSLDFSIGQSSANFWYYEEKNGIWTVYLSDNFSDPDGAAGLIDGEDSVTVSAAPIIATKFIIVPVTNSASIGTPIVVDVRAVNNDNDIDTTYQQDVTLIASGLATGDGLINIVNGVGQASINDTVEEVVNLNLSDTQSTGLNVSSAQTINFTAAAVVPSGGGRSGSVTQTIFFVGRAFPKANVEIMAIQDGQVPLGSLSGGTEAGNFNVSYNGELPSTVDSFAVVVYDDNKHIAQTKIFKLGVNDNLFATVLMAPTVKLKQEIATLGTFLGLTGKAMPKYKIELMIDGVKVPETTISDKDGNYSLNFNTYRLGLGSHNLRVRQIDNAGIASDYSVEKIFSLVKSSFPKADLNGDGKLDIQDWSIFITRYQLIDSGDRGSLDLNGDGLVDTKDFSLFIEALTY